MQHCLSNCVAVAPPCARPARADSSRLAPPPEAPATRSAIGLRISLTLCVINCGLRFHAETSIVSTVYTVTVHESLSRSLVSQTALRRRLSRGEAEVPRPETAEAIRALACAWAASASAARWKVMDAHHSTITFRTRRPWEGAACGERSSTWL